MKLDKYDSKTGEEINRGRTTADDHAKAVGGKAYRIARGALAIIGLICVLIAALSALGLWAIFNGQ